jgi:pimeloyl-ACP methyl ester carboxylesterase
MILETGHVPFAEDPEGFLKILLSFLENVSLNIN